MEKLPKNLKARVATQKQFVKNYVALMSGLLRLTDTELLVLSEIVWNLHIQKDREYVFSPEGRSEIREKLSKTISTQGFNNYLMSLRKKGAIIKNDEGYDVNNWLYPRTEITFRYEVYEKLDRYIQPERELLGSEPTVQDTEPVQRATQEGQEED